MRVLSFLLLPLLLIGTHLDAADPRVAPLLAQGDAAAAREDYAAAIPFFQQAERLEPQNIAVILRLADAHSELLDISKAKVDAEKSLEYGQRALALDPKSAQAHLAVAVGYGRMTDFVGNKTKLEYSRYVKEEAEKSLQLDPREHYAWYLLGRWHFGVANVSGVLKMLAKVVYGGLPPATNEEAERCLRKAVELAPNELSYQAAYARVLAALGRAEEAKKHWRLVLTLKVTDPDDEADLKEAKRELGQ